MHALIPLLFALILINTKQLQYDNCYRVSVLSLVGLSYFVVLQYAIYLDRVFPDLGYTLKYLPMLAAVLVVVCLSLSPLLTRSSPLKAAVLLALFCVGTALSFAFDVKIKNKLAELGGYFSDGPAPFSQLDWGDGARRSLEFPQIGLRVNVPEGWMVEHLPTGHPVLYKQQAAQKSAEIRPNCFAEALNDVPTFVENSLWMLEATDRQHEVECTNSDGQMSCLIKVRYQQQNDVAEHWRWFRTIARAKLHAEADAVFYATGMGLKQEVALILNSVEVLGSRPAHPCTTPAAWM
jgi:hypothetical protein